MQNLIALMKKYREIIAYLFWGVMTTVVSWTTYSLFVILFKYGISSNNLIPMNVSTIVLVSNVLSWLCAALFAFVVNKLWVFESKSWKLDVWVPEFWKFLSARIITGLFEMVSVPLLVGIGLDQTILGIEGMVSKVFVSVIVVVLNYVFSKLIIFK